MVEAATLCPSRRSSPWMRTTPQRRFSRASRGINATSSSGTGGRPGALGWRHLAGAIRHCQRGRHCPVTPRQARHRSRPAQHRDLMPKRSESQTVAKIVLSCGYALVHCSGRMALRTPVARASEAYSPVTWEDPQARRAGFEPTTRCLEGTICALLEVGWSRPVWHLPAVMMAGGSSMWPGVCPRWLPVWLPWPSG
jgi:hypothetical protein